MALSACDDNSRRGLQTLALIEMFVSRAKSNGSMSGSEELCTYPFLTQQQSTDDKLGLMFG